MSDENALLIVGFEAGCEHCNSEGGCNSPSSPENCDGICFGCPSGGTPLGGGGTSGGCTPGGGSTCTWTAATCYYYEYTGSCSDDTFLGCVDCSTRTSGSANINKCSS